ncbi:MAG: hypothetical protein VX366_05990 [Candidatus Thermoplasmatota archaeon]|nr:hypothetical protein [Candidatus Thermoplasmatota archaeon]|tara:strand:+ start:266 stop:442 length:177 start_codon:yes stop_codon:yes gene_type:complete
MSDLTYLTVAYLGMIGALALWTWTVFSRSKNLEAKIEALQKAMDSKPDQINIVMEHEE